MLLSIVVSGASVVMLVPLLQSTGVEEANKGIAGRMGKFLNALGMPSSLPNMLLLFMAFAIGMTLLQRWTNLLATLGTVHHHWQ